MNESIKKLNSYINRYQRGCRMEKVTNRTYTIVANRSSQAEIAKKAIMLNLKVKSVNAYDVFRSLQVYY